MLYSLCAVYLCHLSAVTIILYSMLFSVVILSVVFLPLPHSCVSARPTVTFLTALLQEDQGSLALLTPATMNTVQDVQLNIFLDCSEHWNTPE